jgi:hypothetical protein
MRSMWALFAVATLLQTPAVAPGPRDVQVRAPASFVYLSLDIAGYLHDPRLETRLAAQYGNRALTAGGFHGASVTIVAQPDQPHRASRAWRDELSSGERFEIGEVACSTLAQKIPGDDQSIVHFNAYPVAAGFVFDVHVSGQRSAGHAAVERAEFEAIVRSIRVQFVRRGQPQDLPPDVRNAMNAALTAWPKWREPLERRSVDAPDDVALAFSLGELLRFAEAPKDEIRAAHERAGRLFAALEQPTRAQTVAWILCEESRGLALLTSGQSAEALAPLRKARDMAQALAHVSRAGVSYNLACAAALSNARDEAIAALTAAIEADPIYRATAARDPDLASLAKDERFIALIGAQ